MCFYRASVGTVKSIFNPDSGYRVNNDEKTDKKILTNKTYKLDDKKQKTESKRKPNTEYRKHGKFPR